MKKLFPVILALACMLTACGSTSSAPEVPVPSHPGLTYVGEVGAKGEKLRTARAELGPTSTDEILEVFHTLDADLGEERSTWLGMVTGTVDNTTYQLDSSTPTASVEALLKAQSDHEATVATRTDTVEIFSDYCFEEKACLEDGEFLRSYVQAFLATDTLGTFSLAPADATTYLTVYKSGSAADGASDSASESSGDEAAIMDYLHEHLGTIQLSLEPEARSEYSADPLYLD